MIPPDDDDGRLRMLIITWADRAPFPPDWGGLRKLSVVTIEATIDDDREVDDGPFSGEFVKRVK